MVNKPEHYYPDKATIEKFKKKTLKIVYHHELSDGDKITKKQSTLVTVKGWEILELNDAIGDEEIEPDADDIMKIWGRIKLKLPIEESFIFTKNKIDLVRKALRGCQKSKNRLRYNALLFILDQPFINDCGTIYCFDIERTKEYGKILDKRFKEDKDWQEFISLLNG